MANLQNLAPQFTKENAADMARRAVASRVAREQRERAARQLLAPPTEDASRLQTLDQLQRIDGEINRALDRRDWDSLPTLTAAKERLWKLVRPTAGQLKPGRGKQPGRADLVMPLGKTGG